MKNSQKGFIVPLLLAIIAILVVGVGVYIYSSKKAQVAPISGQNNLVATTTVTSDNSNIKTYTNSQYGFQLQYPNTNGSNFLEVQPSGSYLDEVMSVNLVPGIEINILKNDSGNTDISTLKNEITSWYGVSDWQKVSSSFPCGTSNISDSNINGYTAVKINYNECAEGSSSGTPSSLIFITNSKYIYRIAYSKDLQQGDQILSTFKLTN